MTPQSLLQLLLTISVLLLLTNTATADSIAPSQTCYTSNANFALTFVDNSPQFGDVVQVVAAGTTTSLLSKTTTSSCLFCIFSAPKTGTLTFSENLTAGNYQALLRRSSGFVLATSVTFKLLESGQSCSGTTTPPPTRSPTLRPTIPPTRSPTLRPTPTPTLSPAPPTTVSVNDMADQVMTNARAAIAELIQNNTRLTPEFIRMGFHDCIQVCDGCIDLTVADNNGLAHPIGALAPIVAQFENATAGVSRADIWALAAMVGADAAPHGTITQPINFTQNWFGRVNCENANTVCTNAQGANVPCSATVGPARNMPSVNFDGPSLFKYFTTEYNLTQRQVVALLGAHTVGHLVKNESGIDGPNGWEVNNQILHNEYYNALLGSGTASTPADQLESQSPNWVRAVENNSGTSFPNINRWALTAAGLPLVMLNPDISLVRDLNPFNTDPSTGFVNCAFNANAEPGVAPCNVSSTVTIAAQFSDSNDLWPKEFNAAMDLMLTNGYNRNSCTKAVCQLTTR